jgi:hypothetical protein
VTEAEWLGATKPMPMLKFMCGKARERAFKFFTYYCCRLAWPTMADGRSRRAVETAEQFMVGMATDEQLAEARREAEAACDEAYSAESARPREACSMEKYSESLGAAIAVRAIVHGYTQNVIAKVRAALAFHGEVRDSARSESLFIDLSTAIRDLFGNPFRPATLDPDWRTSTVLALARGIYAERAFDRLPILADALQDAGCDNEEMLSHCRGPGPHARGCWVVDLVLGKA